MTTEISARKRKISEEESIEYTLPQCNNKEFTEIDQLAEEALSKELFGDNSGFYESLNDKSLFALESQQTSKEKTPAWNDADDDNISIQKALKKQNRNLKYEKNKSEKYSVALKNKFLTYHKTPEWASLEKTEDEDDELLRTTGHLAGASSHLSANVLNYKNVSDLNAETCNEGPLITAIDFHPTSTVALVGGVSGTISLFAVDGKNNSKLHSMTMENFSVEDAKFLNDGMEILIGSKHNYVYSFDMLSAKALRVTLPNGVTKCRKFEISPCGKIIAVIGKQGHVHLLSSKSKEIIAHLKQNFDATDLTFHPTKPLLFCHSVNGEVNIWDLTTQRTKHKWVDDGCLSGTTISISPSAQYVSTGSEQGIVNLYDTETTLSQQYPKVIKTIMNLTTSVKNLKFNNTSEILAFASSDINNCIKLMHLQSKKVFSNFPKIGSKLGRLNLLSFSPNSGYFAMGNRNSRVLLYRLKHFKNY